MTNVTCQGVVKGNVVVLDENVELPEGARVEVRLMEEGTRPGERPLAGRKRPTTSGRVIETAAVSRDEAFARVLESGARKAHLRVGLDEIIEEDRRDREERVDEWLPRRS